MEEPPLFKEKKNLIRLIAFLIAAAAAVYAFTTGILQLGHKDPGYYDVGYTAEGGAVLYGSGVHLLYDAQGSGSEVRLALNAAQKTFTAALLHAWQLLDDTQTYEGVVNIASLNQSPGQPMQVGETLYAILADALERTERGEGYSLFSGMLHREWTILRYLDEPADFDPLNNPEEAALLADMAAWLRTPGAFSLTLTAPDTAQFTLSPACAAWVAEQEIDAPILDLNLLRDAYLLELTAAELRSQGITSGYLYSESGYSLWLEQQGVMRYDVYAPGNGRVETAAALAVPAPAAYCQFTAFPTGSADYGYYSLERDGKTYLRHAYVDIADGGFRDVLLSAGLASAHLSLPELGYRMAVLNAQDTPEAVRACLSGSPGDPLAYWILQQDAEKIIHTASPDMAEQLTLSVGSPYTLGE